MRLRFAQYVVVSNKHTRRASKFLSDVGACFWEAWAAIAFIMHHDRWELPLSNCLAPYRSVATHECLWIVGGVVHYPLSSYASGTLWAADFLSFMLGCIAFSIAGQIHYNCDRLKHSYHNFLSGYYSTSFFNPSVGRLDYLIYLV